ncbi:MAG: MgtC/SapB family protein [Patescibacteria group bacterium]
MQHIFGDPVVTTLLLAMVLGMVLGLERFIAHKTAGMRTYTLISMGSALFIIISKMITEQIPSTIGYDYHIAAQIIAAAGFLGVGAIFNNGQRVSGITTASGMWVAAGIGMASGFGLYRLAIIATVLSLFTFVVLWLIEKQVRKMHLGKDEENSPL